MTNGKRPKLRKAARRAGFVVAVKVVKKPRPWRKPPGGFSVTIGDV